MAPPDACTNNVPTSPAVATYSATIPLSGQVELGFLLTSTAVVAQTATWTIDDVVLK